MAVPRSTKAGTNDESYFARSKITMQVIRSAFLYLNFDWLSMMGNNLDCFARQQREYYKAQLMIEMECHQPMAAELAIPPFIEGNATLFFCLLLFFFLSVIRLVRQSHPRQDGLTTWWRHASRIRASHVTRFISFKSFGQKARGLLEPCLICATFERYMIGGIAWCRHVVREQRYIYIPTVRE